MGRRRLARAAAALAVLPLAACSLRGEAWLDAESLRFDVTVAYPSQTDGICRGDSWYFQPLEIDTLDAPRGREACRVTGSISHDDLMSPRVPRW